MSALTKDDTQVAKDVNKSAAQVNKDTQNAQDAQPTQPTQQFCWDLQET